MAASYTAVVQQHENWWIGWVEEVPGVNSQGGTREELLENLRDAREEALETNREDALIIQCQIESAARPEKSLGRSCGL